MLQIPLGVNMCNLIVFKWLNMLKVKISSDGKVLKGNEEALKSDGKALMVDEENLIVSNGNEDAY